MGVKEGAGVFKIKENECHEQVPDEWMLTGFVHRGCRCYVGGCTVSVRNIFLVVCFLTTIDFCCCA